MPDEKTWLEPVVVVGDGSFQQITGGIPAKWRIKNNQIKRAIDVAEHVTVAHLNAVDDTAPTRHVRLAIRLYKIGWSLVRIGEHPNVDSTTVLSRLRERGYYPRLPRTTRS